MNTENLKKVQGSIEKAPATQTPNHKLILSSLEDKGTVAAFDKVMGDKTPIFIQTVRNVLLAPQNKKLRECTPNSVIRSCMACAVTGLSIDPAFGQAAIVPFGSTATFMPMKNGLVQLANNTGLISRLNAGPVYEGDIKAFNPFTGDYEYNTEPHERDIVVGYMAYLRFLNGGDHYLYMTVEELQAHGKKYSKSYYRTDGLWATNFPAMAEKTVIRQILTKWASFDTMANTKLLQALKFDMSTPSSMDIEDAVPLYADSVETDAKIEDVEAEIMKG